MTLSEILVYIAYACVFFGWLIAIVMWWGRYQEIDTSGEGK